MAGYDCPWYHQSGCQHECGVKLDCIGAKMGHDCFLRFDWMKSFLHEMIDRDFATLADQELADQLIDDLFDEVKGKM